ncbi:MAG: diguanylate cyclase [Acidobacteriota bacterium]|nr:diguanylate cyclase [Acidobacteriota bacterium]
MIPATFLVVAILLLLGLSALWEARTASVRVGMDVEEEVNGLRITGVLEDGPASLGDIRPEDFLLAIDGVAVASYEDYDRVIMSRRGQPSVVFTVVREGQRLEQEVIPGRPAEWGFYAAWAIPALVHLAIAFVVLLMPRQSLRSRLLLLLAAAIALELSLPAPWLMTPVPSGALWALVFLLQGLEEPLQLHLAALIPGRNPWIARNRWAIPTVYALSMGAVTPLALNALAPELVPLGATTESVLYFVFDRLLVPLGALISALLLATAAIRWPRAQGRHQAALVLAGLLPWMGLVWLDTAAAAFGRSLPWLEVGLPVSSAFLPPAIFIAIIRYDLLEAQERFRRWLMYSLLTASVVLSLYLLLVFVGMAVLQQAAPGMLSVWLISGVSLLLGLLFSPIRRLIQRSVERRFFPGRVALRRQLRELAADLPGEGKVPAMGQALVRRMAEILDLRSATLLLADPKSRVLIFSATTLEAVERDFDQTFLLAPDDPGVQVLTAAETPLPAEALIPHSAALAQRLAAFEAQIAVPLVNRKRLVGLLLLGQRSSGGRFPMEEVDLMGLFSDHVASALENARLFESATLESLTGLLRREAILEHLDRELQRALRYNRPLSLAMLDLDHFKAVNDQHGHLVGDALLKRIASTLGQNVRSADMLGRYGGEEFLLVMPETELAGAVGVAEKLRSLVAKTPLLVEGEEQPVYITLTVGVASIACFDGEESPRGRQLIELADRRLYRAKDDGRNRVEPGTLTLVR